MFDGDLLDDDEFPGGVFSEEIDGGRSGAHLRLGDRGITARSSEGRKFVISYSDCDLELGGDSGRMVFCRTADRSLTFFCEDRRFPEALKRAAAGELFEQVDQILAVGSRQRWVSRIGLWVMLAVCVLVLIGGYYAVVFGAQLAIEAVPMTVDEQIAEAALPSVLSEFGEEIKSPKAVNAVQSVVDRLAPHSAIQDVNYQVLIIDSDVVNALALPGGRILVFRGLIDTMDSTEQLSAVIAHEMSHVTLRHHLRQISRSVGIVAAVHIVIGDVGGIVAFGTEVLQTAALNNYSQGQETAADLEGARMMHAAGLDPQAMIQMLDSLPNAHLHGPLSWLSTHPNSNERINSVQQFLDETESRDYSQLDFRLEELRTILDNTQTDVVLNSERNDKETANDPTANDPTANDPTANDPTVDDSTDEETDKRDGIKSQE